MFGSGCGEKTPDVVSDTYGSVETKESEDNVSEETSEASQTDTEEKEKTVLYVTGAEKVELRSAENDEIIYLKPKTEVELEQNDLSGEEIKVYCPSEKKTGFVKNIYLVDSKQSVTSGESGYIKTSEAHLNESAGGKGSIIRQLYQGEQINILSKNSGGYWRIITQNGEIGYAEANAIMVDQTASQEPNVSSSAAKRDHSGSSGNSGASSAGSAVSNNNQNEGDNTVTYYYYNYDPHQQDTETSSQAQQGYTPAPQPEESQSDNSTADQSEAASIAPQTEEPYASTGDNEAFKASVAKAIANVGGNWSAALIELNSGSSTYVNDSQMQAASLIKLYIMGAVYENYDDYKAAEPSLDTYLYQMITISDNSAANALVRVLGSGSADAGKAAVTAYCSSHGYYNSSMGRLLLESTINGDNYTSAGDCARFLQSVYNGELSHSSDMMNLLKQQTRTSKIPAGVSVPTANKTGELANVENDAAIVFAEKPYVLCVMSENVPSGSAVSAIVKLSSETYANVK